MRKKRLFLSVAWFAVVMEVAWSFPTEAAPANEALTIGYSSFSGHYVPLWIAVEDRLGRKYGLDLKAVYAGRARPTPRGCAPSRRSGSRPTRTSAARAITS